MKNLIEKHVLNEIKIHIYVIEFQKKKLFYVYLLFINYSKNDVITINVDVVVQTIIFFEFNDNLFKLIKKHMIYKNCKIKLM